MKSSFARSFTAVTLVLLLALVSLGASIRYLVQHYLVETAMSSLETEAVSVAHLASSYFEADSLNTWELYMNADIAARVTGSDILICSSEGTIELCSENPFVCSHRDMTLSGTYLDEVRSQGISRFTGIVTGLYTESRYLVAAPIQDADGNFLGTVIVSTSTDSTGQVVSRLEGYFLYCSLVVMLIALLGIILMTGVESRPLRALAQAANAFGHGDLEARVSVDKLWSDEIQDLAVAFNNMASSLQKSEYQRQEFVANVSHELKTPITTIAGYIDGVLDGTIPEDRQSHYLRIASDESKRLGRLVRSMLDISRLQSGGIPEEKKISFDMEECAGQALLTFEQKISGKKLEVQVDMPEHPVFTFADRDAVTQVIYNLLDNAVKFCPEGGTLGLKIQESGGKVYTSVSNEGDTIPPEELPLVFDRFHKLDKSRSLNRDGWGLGLYIVKTIVGSHGEDIRVTSRNGVTEFTFTMPLIN